MTRHYNPATKFLENATKQMSRFSLRCTNFKRIESHTHGYAPEPRRPCERRAAAARRPCSAPRSTRRRQCRTATGRSSPCCMHEKRERTCLEVGGSAKYEQKHPPSSNSMLSSVERVKQQNETDGINPKSTCKYALAALPAKQKELVGRVRLDDHAVAAAPVRVASRVDWHPPRLLCARVGMGPMRESNGLDNRDDEILFSAMML